MAPKAYRAPCVDMNQNNDTKVRSISDWIRSFLLANMIQRIHEYPRFFELCQSSPISTDLGSESSKILFDKKFEVPGTQVNATCR